MTTKRLSISHRRHRTGTLALAGAIFVGLLPHAGQAQTSPGDRLAAVSAASSLKTVAQPIHLKLKVTAFDANGKNPHDGTIEYWQEGAENRAVYAFGGVTLSTYHHNGASFIGTGPGTVPEVARVVLDAMLSLGPSTADLAGSVPEVQQNVFGKFQADCFIVKRAEAGKVATSGTSALQTYPTYCLSTDDQQILLRFRFGTEIVIPTKFANFQGQRITAGLAVRANTTIVANADITELRSFTPGADEFAPPPNAEQILVAGEAEGASLTNHKTGGDVPQYPVSARVNHISGSVVLHALIGTDGKMHALGVLYAPNADLAASAMAAVRTWTYKPYLLNGQPVPLDTEIAVHFNLSP